MGRAIAQFAAAGLVATLLLGLVGALLLSRLGRSQAIDGARELTTVVGRAAIEPLIDEGVLRGDADALTRLDTTVRERVRRDPVVRVKLWDAGGRILYSDERRLIGMTFPLGEEERQSLVTGATESGTTNLASPENRFEPPGSQLVEVYTPVHAIDGTPLLFETYLRSEWVQQGSRRIWLSYAPALLGSLVLVELVQVPLAWSMVRRLRQGQREREALLRRALDASVVERRRIARDLHDGVVQDLAGVSYALSAAAERLDGDGSPQDAPSTGPDGLRATLTHAATTTREGMRELRTLLVELYPANLQTAGLAAALADLTAALEAKGVEVAVRLPEHLELEPDVERAIYRSAQESLRNVGKHAGARHAAVTVAREDGVVRLIVEDDGKGFETGSQADDGHLGLRLLADLAEEAGGRLEISSSPGTGTRVALELPA